MSYYIKQKYYQAIKIFGILPTFPLKNYPLLIQGEIARNFKIIKLKYTFSCQYKVTNRVLPILLQSW